jgi:hypothetical protein
MKRSWDAALDVDHVIVTEPIERLCGDARPHMGTYEVENL